MSVRFATRELGGVSVRFATRELGGPSFLFAACEFRGKFFLCYPRVRGRVSSLLPASSVVQLAIVSNGLRGRPSRLQ